MYVSLCLGQLFDELVLTDQQRKGKDSWVPLQWYHQVREAEKIIWVAWPYSPSLLRPITFLYLFQWQKWTENNSHKKICLPFSLIFKNKICLLQWFGDFYLFLEARPLSKELFLWPFNQCRIQSGGYFVGNIWTWPISIYPESCTILLMFKKCTKV